jgi:hypothetical protein
MATSLDNPPRINQRCQVEADNINLQFDSVIVLDHGANDGTFVGLREDKDARTDQRT